MCDFQCLNWHTLFRMAMIVGGLTAVAQISSAVAGTVVLVNKINNDNAERMAVISAELEHAMGVLTNEQNSENNRHKEFMALLDKLFEAITTLGESIFGAECDGCKGLPGFTNSFIMSIMSNVNSDFFKTQETDHLFKRWQKKWDQKMRCKSITIIKRT